MKLEVWQRAIDLFALVFEQTGRVADFKLRSQITDAAQSVSANIAEGYCRRTLPEYLQFLYFAKGSLGECLTRSIGLHRVNLLAPDQFESIDTLHYEVENKLLGLIVPSKPNVPMQRGTTPCLPLIHHPPSTIQ